MAQHSTFIMDSVSLTSPYSVVPFLGPKTEERSNSQSEFECQICNVKCCGPVPYEQHLHGAGHRKQLQVKGIPLVCNLCDLTFTSPEHLEGHINGQKHQRKLKSSGLAPGPTKTIVASVDTTPNVKTEVIATTTSDTQLFHCLACDLICSSNDQLTTHLNGKRHAKKCKQQANYWLGTAKAAQSDKNQTAQINSSKTNKRRTFFRLPKNHPETSPELLLEMENALPLERISDEIAELPFCFLPSQELTSVEEPEPKRTRTELKPDGSASGSVPEPNLVDVSTRFCCHLNCALGRAAKLYQLTLKRILGPSYTPQMEMKLESGSDVHLSTENGNTE